MLQTFSADNFHTLCDQLAQRDADLSRIIATHGYPPLWQRPNSFETLVHIILEQQVSLASAKAALEKLREKIGVITPNNIMLLGDEELKTAYFSRQKISYVRFLSQELLNGNLDLTVLADLPDSEVRAKLLTLKGIGNWTVDIYLIMVLQRQNIFPFGDLAVVTALKRLKALPTDTSHEVLKELVAPWQPYLTIATMLLWHYYLSEPRPARRKLIT